MGLPDDFDAAQIQQTWLELQAELAALSTNSEHILVKDSTHAIELDKPDVVITAILDMVEMVR
jgi:pimeloyl-ACP methyl ester carboxylesterase